MTCQLKPLGAPGRPFRGQRQDEVQAVKLAAEQRKKAQVCASPGCVLNVFWCFCLLHDVTCFLIIHIHEVFKCLIEQSVDDIYIYIWYHFYLGYLNISIIHIICAMHLSTHSTSHHVVHRAKGVGGDLEAGPASKMCHMSFWLFFPILFPYFNSFSEQLDVEWLSCLRFFVIPFNIERLI